MLVFIGVEMKKMLPFLFATIAIWHVVTPERFLHRVVVGWVALMTTMIGLRNCGPVLTCLLSLRAIWFFCREQIYPIMTERSSHVSVCQMNLVKREINGKAATHKDFSTEICCLQTTSDLWNFQFMSLNVFIFIWGKWSCTHSVMTDWAELRGQHTHTCSAACSAVTHFVVISYLPGAQTLLKAPAVKSLTSQRRAVCLLWSRTDRARRREGGAVQHFVAQYGRADGAKVREKETFGYVVKSAKRESTSC